MSSPVGHILGAAAAYRGSERLTPEDAPRGSRGFLFVAALALVPDLDIAWGWMQGDGTMFHRGVTHSLGFAAVLALTGSIVWFHSLGPFTRFRRTLAFLGTWLALTAACAVHPLLDYLMGCGPKLPLFAPFRWDGFIASRRFVPTAYYVRRLPDAPGLVTHWPTIRGVLMELWIFMPLVLATKPGRPWLVRLVFLALSASALVATYLVYN